MSTELNQYLGYLRRWGYLLCLPLWGWLLTTIVFVDESEWVIVERLGQIVAVYDRPEDKGWQWKAPWPVDTVRRFDRRIQMLVPPAREVFTRDRKNLVVEASVCWRIAASPSQAPELSDRPVVKFYRGLGQLRAAETRLGSRLQALLSTQLGRLTLAELLSASASDAAPGSAPSPLVQLARDLQQLLARQPEESQSWTERLGLEIVDVRIHRLNLPSGNLQAVYERMRSERQKIAERYRSAGLAESTAIRSQAERRAGEILARAKAEAERIKAAGEAEALAILNAAYARDPEFAQRLQQLEAYRQLINDRTRLILSADSPLWRLLIQGETSTEFPPKPIEDVPLSAERPSNAQHHPGAQP